MKSTLNRITTGLSLGILTIFTATQVLASSHREAPLIANDPLADNTDVYAFRSPDDPNTITIIANYIPMQLPHGGPNYYAFGENVRYEIHIDNDASTPGDDITYRFTFNKVNEDPSTFFNIRLGAQNQKNTYTLEKSVDGGQTFVTIISNGVVPPYNVGDRSIDGPVGLNATYETLFNNAITTASTGESVFAGHIEDPFFVDLGGIFDLGDAPRQNGMPRDALACYNVSTIAIKVNIADLQKDGLSVSSAANILDSEFVIGVWASASRPQIRTLTTAGTRDYSGDWVQVSRLGMPLTNEAVIAIGDKDYWNSITPYEELADQILDKYFYNPELALYMDDAFFASAVPAFDDLRIQKNSLQSFGFGNTQDGLFPLKNTPALDGTVLETGSPFVDLLLPGAGQPRSIDLWPLFHTGVPNARPYQLATGKGGNPLAAGKPFINNFLPNGGDMLRLNMAVPITPRDSEAFSSLGLIAAAVAGLTDPIYASTDLEFIPNMDGFPNGRRLEDDVTRIALQAVAGVVLSAIGLWEDDYNPMEDASPVTPMLLATLGYTTGVEENDVDFRTSFPYVQLPFSGKSECSGRAIEYVQPEILEPTEFVEMEACYGDSILEYVQGTKLNGSPIDANRTDPSVALGEPNRMNAPGSFVSLGYGGSVSIMFAGAVYDEEGDDILVWETSFNSDDCESDGIERAQIELSMDGINWIPAGTVCRNGGVDIADAGLEFVIAIKIINDSSSTTFDGYDVDGVEAINGCQEIPDFSEDCFGSEVLTYNPGPMKNGQPITDPKRIDPAKALGAPQLNDTFNFVSLGYGGELIIGFPGVVTNGPGPDILVAETTFGNQTFETYPESADVFVSQNGVDFFMVGSMTTKQVALFDIDDAGQGFDFITAVKVVDTTPQGSVSDDGFDVDAVQALNGCVPFTELVPGACVATESVLYTQGTRRNGGALPVNRTDETQALGEPEGTDEMVFVTLGYGGSIILGFDGPVLNQAGADLEIVETSFGNAGCAAYKEYADVYVSQDGINYFFTRTVCKSDNLVEIDDAGQGFTSILFVKIVNNDELTKTPDGFDLDGVRALHNCDEAVPAVASNDRHLASEYSQTRLSSMPNPTQGNSQVTFVVDNTSRTVLEVYDMSGRNVATLYNEVANEGQEYRVSFEGTHLPNGVYMYRLFTGNSSVTEKFLIAR